MQQQLRCPKCSSGDSYLDGNFWICPECSHEWNPANTLMAQNSVEPVVRDAHGNELKDGDTVIVVKDLKVKGSSSALKAGTKVKKIRLLDGDDGHNIDCRIDGIGAMRLKSEFVRKSGG